MGCNRYCSTVGMYSNITRNLTDLNYNFYNIFHTINKIIYYILLFQYRYFNKLNYIYKRKTKNMNNNIILIGMPGAGKSTVGVVLAKKLGYTFIDSDIVIQDEKGMLLHELITKFGIDGFNEIENEVNSKINVKNSVIATGGSAVYGKEAMEHFKSIGQVVYLKLPYDEIENRLGDLNERGVSIKKGQTLSSLYEERAPLYEKYSDITIDCNELSIRDIVSKISEKVTKSFPDAT